MSRVAIIETGLSNIDSVRRAAEEVGSSPYPVRSVDSLGEPDHIILPGVGSFSAAMSALQSAGLDRAIREQVLEFGVPLLGICLGMQMLMGEGIEGGNSAGLGLIAGGVHALEPDRVDERLPHVGWNQLDLVGADPLFDEVPLNADFYFVHSYKVVPEDSAVVIATTPYCGGFPSVIRLGDVIGVQFHPEKSHRAGLRLIKSFVGT